MTMTDKQIIVDGIDVSKCVHLQKGIDCNAYIDFSECCDGYDARLGYCPNIDCYYKQLKYLEKAFDYREETYITNLNNLANEAKFLREKLKAKEQECEELKRQLTILDDETIVVEITEKQFEEYKKLKKNLTEIKEIAEYTIDMFDEGLETGGTYDRVEQILQKCEVVDEN